MHLKLATRVLLTGIVTISAGTVAWAAYSAFPLAITFAPTAPGPGLSDDGGPYMNKTEGKVPVVMMNRDGLIVLDTRRSTRTLCFDFDSVRIQDGPAAALAPKDVCAPVLLHTLVRPDNQRAADVPIGGALDFGMDVYWSGPAEGGGSYDYVLELKRADGNGVTVSHPDADTWTVQNILYAQVSVYRRGKGAGWSVVGLYDMPVSFVAVRN